VIRSWRGLLHESLVFKFFLVFVATSLLVLFMVAGFFRMLVDFHPDNPVHKNIRQYSNYLAQDLGAPPSLERARVLARDLSLDIRYEGRSGQWTTSPGLPTIAECAACRSGIYGKGRKHFLMVDVPDGKLLFSPHLRPYWDGPAEAHLALMLMLLLLVFAAAWVAVRIILHPVRILREGVAQISRGNLDYRIPVRGRDELGRLAQSFNEMVRQLGEIMRAKEQLLLDVSHEIRTPLTRIKLAMEFLPAGRTRRGLEEDLRELDQMLEELLESARLQSPYGGLKRTQVDLTDLVRQAVAGFKGRKPGFALELGQVRLSADQERVRKVITNLLGNAVKYSPPRSRPIAVRLESRGGNVFFEVQDHGTGVPEADLQHIFEPFYRVDRSRSKDTGGFGLGLSLCRRIVEAHGGRIYLESKLYVGTKVSIFLPKNLGSDQSG